MSNLRNAHVALSILGVKGHHNYCDTFAVFRNAHNYVVDFRSLWPLLCVKGGPCRLDDPQLTPSLLHYSMWQLTNRNYEGCYDLFTSSWSGNRVSCQLWQKMSRPATVSHVESSLLILLSLVHIRPFSLWKSLAYWGQIWIMGECLVIVIIISYFTYMWKIGYTNKTMV